MNLIIQNQTQYNQNRVVTAAEIKLDSVTSSPKLQTSYNQKILVLLYSNLQLGNLG